MMEDGLDPPTYGSSHTGRDEAKCHEMYDNQPPFKAYLDAFQAVFKASGLNPQPSTLNPQPCTMNPGPWTLNPEP